jgi:glyoxylase-like metal-dependent hydrolase (beta-lactamase superfamily II)
VIATVEEALAVAGEALASDAPAWEVDAVRYGTRMTTRAECYANYEALGEPDAPLRMDYFFWLLRGDEGTILVDSGFDPEVGERRGRTTICPPLEALERLGVAPADVPLALLTHLHYDHTGNLRHLPEARFVVAASEVAFWTGPGSEGEQAGPIERDEIAVVATAAACGRARLLTRSEVVAPGVGAILVGGHSPGQLSLIVKTADAPVLLASDAVHYYEEYERELPFEISVDLDEMIGGYGLLRRVAEATNAVLVPGHDPEVCERFPNVPGDLDGVALRLA